MPSVYDLLSVSLHLVLRIQENNLLKEQLQALIQENVILKRAVSIQHERQKEFEGKSQELHNLKQLASQYQEQLRTLEVNLLIFILFIFCLLIMILFSLYAWKSLSWGPFCNAICFFALVPHMREAF